MGTILRWLRIAFSGLCGCLCALVIFFWVRSYSYADGGFLWVPPNHHIQIHAGLGRMCIWFELKPISFWASWSAQAIRDPIPPAAADRIPHFDLAFYPRMARLYAAHWVFAVATGLGAVLPWAPRKFDLRQALMAMTVVAAIVALIAWIDRTF